jgi:amidase
MNILDGFTPATEMLRALRERQVSAVELLDIHLRRIGRYNPRLNAIISPDYEQARQLAETADAARGRGEDRPLLGLPLTLKDSINVQGLRTTVGMPDWAEARVDFDDPLTSRLRAAGAVIMGKTNVPALIWDWQAHNPIFGQTNNPWDLERTPGGSSGGGAAALAAGLTPLEFGSDISGSIRVPAAFCGIYGHKPSETALPRSGQFPFPPLPNAALAMGVVGPLARSADDLELAFAVAAGPEVGEDVAWRLAMPPARHTRLADYRIAVLPELPWLPVDPEILAVLDRLVGLCRRAGAKVGEAQPALLGDLRQHHQVYSALLWTNATMLATPATQTQLAELFRTRGDEFAAAALRGLEATAGDYVGLFRERERYRVAYRAFFQDWDVLLTPITLSTAFPHQAMPWPPMVSIVERKLDVDGQSIPYDLQSVYPAVATLSGQPATAFPIGLSRIGLPIGLQVIGPYLEDYTPIRFTALVAEEWGGFRPPVGYDEGTDGLS